MLSLRQPQKYTYRSYTKEKRGIKAYQHKTQRKTEKDKQKNYKTKRKQWAKWQ
jgi:hypothetical protein